MPLPFRSAPSRLPFIAFAVFFILSLLSRVALLVAARHFLTWNLSLAGVFGCGLFFDVMSGLFAAVPWVIYAALAPDNFLRSRAGRTLTMLGMVIFSSILIFITVSEWFFWDEFGVRFNFIAVDYLIWTQEVLGNITESYPMVPIMSGIILLGAGVVWLLHRKGILNWAVKNDSSWASRGFSLVVGLGLPTLAALFVTQSSMPAFTNQYHGELAKNGCWSFLAAYHQMELKYDEWYPKLPQDEAIASTKKLLVTENEKATSSAPDDLHRTITGRGEERRWNVIIICMESYSAEYMAYAVGKKKGLSPNLDRLATQSIFFDNFFATGTR
ncbi:MAG: LTA synthase family protein, partial [Luteolibacter sp.]